MSKISSYPLKPVLDGTEELVAVHGTSTYKFTPEEIRKYGILTGFITKTLNDSGGDFTSFDEFYEWISGNIFSNATITLHVTAGTFSSTDRIPYEFGPKGINELIIMGNNSTESILEVNNTHEDDFFIKMNNCKLTLKQLQFLNSGVDSTSLIELNNVNTTITDCVFSGFNTAIKSKGSSFLSISETSFNSPTSGTTDYLLHLTEKSFANIKNTTHFIGNNVTQDKAILITEASSLYVQECSISDFLLGLDAQNNGKVYLNDTDSITYSGNGTNESPVRNLIQPRGGFISDGTRLSQPEPPLGDPMILEVTTTSSNTSMYAEFGNDGNSESANVHIDWGDGYTTTLSYPYEDDVYGHNYVDPGVYNITITGTADRFYIYDSIYSYLTDIKQWGSLKLKTFNYFFEDCEGLTTITATDTLDTSHAADFYDMFYSCSNLTSLDVTNWDMSNAVKFSYAFSGCDALTTITGLETWDVSSVRTFYSMFYNCTSLSNIDVSTWDVSNCLDFEQMFYNTYSLGNLDLSGWDVSRATTFYAMFRDSTANPDVSTWNPIRCTSFNSMFRDNAVANPDVSNWQFTENDNVTTSIGFSYMFQNATSANPDISGWNIKNVGHFINFLDGSAFSTENYDKMLIAWSQQDAPNGRTFDCRDTAYSGSNPDVVQARKILVEDRGWTFNDAGSV